MIIGADTGGTFTDFVAIEDGAVCASFKTPSTPVDYSVGIDAGLERLVSERRASELVHASTVATNALLERRGGLTALVTTTGFRDLLILGRQQRPSLYDLSARPAEPLVPRTRCFEVAERVSADGEVLVALEDAEIERVVESVAASGAQSVAVCLLFSFLNPRHEQRIGRAASRRGLAVSLSSDIAPEFREYERASTTVANAFVAPIVERYLERVVARVSTRAVETVRVVLSNGASLDAGSAAERPIQTVLSGPVAGVVGAHAAARDVLGPEARAISLDMGGTSTDVALISGQPAMAATTTIGGCPLQIPVVDIHTVGAGGGSIARVDAGGALRVGPDSAGAEPGPAAYGRGGPATVTDANLVLGRMRSDRFLDGRVRLDPAAARAAIGTVARTMGADTVSGARGIVALVNAGMERSLRVISVERGRDPRDYALIAFGGAGGLHACALAESLGMRTVIVPRDPGVLSALGAATSGVAFEFARTVMTPVSDRDSIASGFEALARRADEKNQAAGRDGTPARIERFVDARYRGQSYELTIPWSDDGEAAGALHAAHERRYGFAVPDAGVEIVTLRLRAIVRAAEAVARTADGRCVLADAVVDEGPAGSVIDRALLASGERVRGPALFVESYATTFLAPGWHAVVEPHGHLVMEPEVS